MDKWKIFQVVARESVIHRILLHGVPGTGKTTRAIKTSESNGHYSVTLTEDSAVAELIGHWVPKGSQFEWHDGVATRAMREGKLLVVNEVDQAAGSVMVALLQIMDDREITHIDLPNGERVVPKDGFRVIATMNGKPGDLPLPLVDRFDVKLAIDMPHPDAIKTLPKKYQKVVANAYKSGKKNVSFRDVLALSKLEPILGEEAYSVVFGGLAEDMKAIVKIGTKN